MQCLFCDHLLESRGIRCSIDSNGSRKHRRSYDCPNCSAYISVPVQLNVDGRWEIIKFVEKEPLICSQSWAAQISSKNYWDL